LLDYYHAEFIVIFNPEDIQFIIYAIGIKIFLFSILFSQFFKLLPIIIRKHYFLKNNL